MKISKYIQKITLNLNLINKFKLDNPNSKNVPLFVKSLKNCDYFRNKIGT